MENQLSPYRVTLHEEKGDKFQLVFDCMAENADHAAEQAENAYAGCEVLNCVEFEGNLPPGSWQRNLRPGDEVWWNDPDLHKSSGIYRIASINSDNGVLFDDTVLMLRNEAGSDSEVFARELSPSQPENLFPVVDGDSGSIDTYGYATSKEEAIEVGNETFGNEVFDAFLAENVMLRDGTTVAKAWVALTSRVVRMRLTLDVTYSLNGEAPEDMGHRLKNAAESAIQNGILTGDSAAEVEEYSMDVMETEEPLSEEEVTAFMRQRIEDGQLPPEDIAVRLARYGLMEAPAFVSEMLERMEMVED